METTLMKVDTPLFVSLLPITITDQAEMLHRRYFVANTECQPLIHQRKMKALT